MYGFILTDILGTTLSLEDQQIFKNLSIAGVVLFSRNYTSRIQLTKLCCEIKKIRHDLIISVDQEGGFIQRFKQEFTKLPAAKSFGKYPLSIGTNLAKNTAWLMAIELLSCGIDLSLAPVVDLDLANDTIIKDRAFASSYKTVTSLASAWIQGAKTAGMAVVLKHFPGHGSVHQDSHLCLPVDNRTFADIANKDMQTFSSLIKTINIEAVMPAHILFPKIDKVPVCFSSIWLQKILRNQLQFKGIIISDCISMQGAEIIGDYSARVSQALKAGCDLVILCNRSGLLQVLADKSIKTTSTTQTTQLLNCAKVNLTTIINSKQYIATKKLLINAGLCS